jgi:hypothetical protein
VDHRVNVGGDVEAIKLLVVSSVYDYCYLLSGYFCEM